jgi:hypothetical protein
MAPTCFGLRPSSGNLQLSLAKLIFILKHSVKLCRNLLCVGVAACPSMACVLCAVLCIGATKKIITLFVKKLASY